MSQLLCYQCRHWAPNQTVYPEEYPLLAPENEWRDGKCRRLLSVLSIELRTGWDGGYVRHIETPASFGCVMGEPPGR